jgi:type II secretory pathway component PulF
VTQGSSLHLAFEKHPYVFESIYIGLIRTGEVTGRLGDTLLRLGSMLEQQTSNRAKIKSAVFYPKIVLGFMGVVVLVVVYFVVPKLKAFLNSLGQDLPLITQLVVKTSDFFISYWYLVLLGGAAIYFSFKAYAATPGGRRRVDRIKLKLPVFGSLFMNLELNNYCALLDLLLSSGMTLFESFEVLKATQSNQIIRDEIDRCGRVIQKGGSLGEGLRTSKIFPISFVAMLAIGEESGMLPKVLQKMSKSYQNLVEYQLNNLSKMIEPLLLAVIFVMTGILALAIFLPIWKMSSAIHT